MKYFKLFLKNHKGKLFLAILLLLCSVVGTLLIPTLIANVVDHGIQMCIRDSRTAAS